ncbi:hypothetical protein AU15_16035 [Marinobacter salarius]|uniref:Uncharacterized protein n=1 Tax=Marinobacter salarius TaxID=1420917 RepID=W5YW54_9GAMM|nr:hypothetical protein AU15_16035 [Marinobacter salarius]
MAKEFLGNAYHHEIVLGSVTVFFRFREDQNILGDQWQKGIH